MAAPKLDQILQCMHLGRWSVVQRVPDLQLQLMQFSGCLVPAPLCHRHIAHGLEVVSEQVEKTSKWRQIWCALALCWVGLPQYRGQVELRYNRFAAQTLKLVHVYTSFPASSLCSPLMHSC